MFQKLLFFNVDLIINLDEQFWTTIISVNLYVFSDEYTVFDAPGQIQQAPRRQPVHDRSRDVTYGSQHTIGQLLYYVVFEASYCNM